MVTCIQYSPSLFLARNIYLEYFSQSYIIIIMTFFLGSVLTKRAKPESPYFDHPSVCSKSVGIFSNRNKQTVETSANVTATTKPAQAQHVIIYSVLLH